MRRLKIEFDFSFIFIITLSAVLLKSEITFYSLLASVIHEAGHIISFLCLEEGEIKIKFNIRGISALAKCKRKEGIVLLSGPAVNFLCLLLYPLFPTFSLVSLVMGSLNLLPFGENDGARLLNRYMEKNYEFLYKERALKIIGGLFLIPVSVFLCLIVFKNHNNFTLLIFAVYIIIYLLKTSTLD